MEKVILVDENNNEIGFEEKMAAHEKGLLHRAFSIFIFNENKELMLQRRAQEKYHNGGKWTNTVCSHPKAGESYQKAVHRRLKEEMGFDCQLVKRGCFVYKAKFPNGLIEHEYDCVFVGNYNNEPKLNPEEAMDWKWISIPDLKKEIEKNSDNYTFWMKEILNKGILD